MSFDETSFTLSIEAGVTTNEDQGVYLIQIKLLVEEFDEEVTEEIKLVILPIDEDLEEEVETPNEE